MDPNPPPKISQNPLLVVPSRQALTPAISRVTRRASKSADAKYHAVSRLHRPALTSRPHLLTYT
eukprot:4228697-Ditylum_brightwellii.AAC.1